MCPIDDVDQLDESPANITRCTFAEIGDTARYALNAIDMLHVIPLNDLMPHHESLKCPCNPVSDSECNTVIIHNAFDGREMKEQEYESR